MFNKRYLLFTLGLFLYAAVLVVFAKLLELNDKQTDMFIGGVSCLIIAGIIIKATKKESSNRLIAYALVPTGLILLALIAFF